MKLVLKVSAIKNALLRRIVMVVMFPIMVLTVLLWNVPLTLISGLILWVWFSLVGAWHWTTGMAEGTAAMLDHFVETFKEQW